jgi:putative transposase
MKAYTLDLRERVVKFLQAGGSKAEAGHRFAVARRTVYRYLAAAKAGKLDPQKLTAHVKKQPDATLKEIATALAVSPNAVWVRLGKLGFTLKKTHKIPRAQRGATLALPARTRKVPRPARLLPRQVSVYMTTHG